MREPLDAGLLERFLRELGRVTRRPGRLYLTGGATAVREGWRESTIDIDVRFEPEDDDVMRHLPALKERLQVSVELASPPLFIPEVPGWRDRSLYVGRYGALDVFHFDPYSQALAKIERGLDHDLSDVEAMIGRGLVEPHRLRALFALIEPDLFRHPAIDPAGFARRVDAAARPWPDRGHGHQ